MKNKLAWILVLALIISLLGTTGGVFAEPAPAEGEAISAEGESAEGESAEDAAPAEGESAEGESAEDAVPAEGESAEGESTEDAAPAEGESAEGTSDEGESADAEITAEAAVAEGESAEGESDSAETEAAPSPEYVPMPDVEYSVIEADGEQIRLSYLEDVTPILEADGLKFKDMNKNGELDAYEDWRLSTEDRVNDLISQLSLEEEVGLLFQTSTWGYAEDVAKMSEKLLYEMDCPFAIVEGGPVAYYSMSWFAENWHINSFCDNTNGTPDILAIRHNTIQSIMEKTAFGIPATFTCDRQYDVWGGYIDISRSAFGHVTDLDLASKLWTHYGEAMASVGFQVSLNPTAAQLATSNGEDPAHVAEMTTLEISSYCNDRMTTCSKHFIFGAYGGIIGGSRTEISDITENQLYTWQAAIDAGTGWIMNNYGVGLDGNCLVDYDSETQAYLRDTMGYNGVVMTDGWTLGMNYSLEGYTANDGTDLESLSTVERYKLLLENGVDVFLGVTAGPGIEADPSYLNSNFPEAIIYGVENSIIDKSLVDRSAGRVLASKFDLQQFDDPYVDLAYAMELNCSEEYIAQPWQIVTNEDLRAARNPEVVAMEDALMAASAVLIKNEDNTLPLAGGTKVYYKSNNGNNVAFYSPALSEKLVLTDNIEEADIVLADLTFVDDAAELIMDDAAEYGKPVVIVSNGADPDTWEIENAKAVLSLSFSQTPDHGKAETDTLVYLTDASVYTALLMGEAQPTGVTTNEISREEDAAAWADLATDNGVSDYVRLILLATMRENETHSVPDTYSQAIIPAGYGMQYGGQSEFDYDTLLLPLEVTMVETESSGSTSTTMGSVEAAKTGKPFTVTVLIWNNGDDGLVTVPVYDGETLIAQKTYGIKGGSWRIAEIEVVLDTSGEHELTVGDITRTISILDE